MYNEVPFIRIVRIDFLLKKNSRLEIIHTILHVISNNHSTAGS